MASKFTFVLHTSGLMHQTSMHCLRLGVRVQLTAGRASCHCSSVSVLCWENETTVPKVLLSETCCKVPPSVTVRDPRNWDVLWVGQTWAFGN